KLSSKSPAVLDHIGDVYFVLGKNKEAKKYWIKAILLVKNKPLRQNLWVHSCLINLKTFRHQIKMQDSSKYYHQ
ncbi:MAG: hypothetical protein KAV41_03465, partial [Candidatus Pacebacteria bacterium]|nr:hypothetical protein [Candidatus Paceibacterota bacterium]